VLLGIRAESWAWRMRGWGAATRGEPPTARGLGVHKSGAGGCGHYGYSPTPAPPTGGTWALSRCPSMIEWVDFG